MLEISKTGWLAFVLLLFTVLGVAANEPTVEAELEKQHAILHEPVALAIHVNGARSAAVTAPKVDGLEIVYVGPQTRIEMHNFDVTQSVTHHYEVIPRREGEFTIPAFSVRVARQTINTQPLKLTVSSSGGPSGSGGSGEEAAAPGDGSDLLFARWELPKTTLYVGEVIPAELRLYIGPGVRLSLSSLPTVKADGLTVRDLPREPRITRVERDGKVFDVVTFKTAISAAKVGQLKLEATPIVTKLQVQERRQNRRRSRGGIHDLFDDPFFNQHFGVTTREVPVIAPEVELEIKPLPTEGRPAAFSGAVGQFELATKASPVKGKAGDPITVTMAVSGKGSFPRVNAPVIAQQEGWQLYPPSQRFQAKDDVEIAGIKTFEQAAIPTEPQAELPEISFSYFDPRVEKYVTLKGDPIPLEIAAGTASPSPTASTPAPGGTAAPTATPAGTADAPALEAQDILFIRTEGDGKVRSFQAVWQRPIFLWAQVIPLLALLMGAAVWWRQRRAGDVAAQRKARLRSERAEALRTLKDASAPASRFYEEAVRAFRVAAALQSDRDELHATADDLCRGRSLDGETTQTIAAAFEKLDELRYAAAREIPVSPERRAAILEALKHLEKSHVG